MNSATTVETLKGSGAIPKDSVIISTHNNLITRSEREKTVSRISSLAVITARADPGDLVYAHRLSYEIGQEGAVLAPFEKEPAMYGDIIISTFPARSSIDWTRVSANTLLRAALKLNEFPLDRNVISQPIRRADVNAYAQDRLEYVRQSNKDSESQLQAELVQSRLDEYDLNYNFLDMTEADEALVHGDMQSSNVVMDDLSDPLFIDLDSLAIGPKSSDLASWAVRTKRGDPAPIDEVMAAAFKANSYQRDDFHVMVGWKVISSMTHTLRNGEVASRGRVLYELANIAKDLKAPGMWDFDKLTK